MNCKNCQRILLHRDIKRGICQVCAARREVGVANLNTPANIRTGKKRYITDRAIMTNGMWWIDDLVLSRWQDHPEVVRAIEEYQIRKEGA